MRFRKLSPPTHSLKPLFCTPSLLTRLVTKADTQKRLDLSKCSDLEGACGG